MNIQTIFQVQGWLSKGEAKVLQKHAIKQQKRSKSDLLEIGSWKGRSSIVIASVLSEDRRLWLVDHFWGGPERTPPKSLLYVTKYKRRGKPWAYSELLENIIKYSIQDKVIILPLDSDKAAQVVNEFFSFIFIDGDHCYEGVSKDCDLWLPHLEKNGALIFHDYHHPPVYEFCNELKQNKNLSVTLELNNIIVFENLP